MTGAVRRDRVRAFGAPGCRPRLGGCARDRPCSWPPRWCARPRSGCSAAGRSSDAKTRTATRLIVIGQFRAGQRAGALPSAADRPAGPRAGPPRGTGGGLQHRRARDLPLVRRRRVSAGALRPGVSSRRDGRGTGLCVPAFPRHAGRGPPARRADAVAPALPPRPLALRRPSRSPARRAAARGHGCGRAVELLRRAHRRRAGPRGPRGLGRGVAAAAGERPIRGLAITGRDARGRGARPGWR